MTYCQTPMTGIELQSDKSEVYGLSDGCVIVVVTCQLEFCAEASLGVTQDGEVD